jgi:TonB family protein
MSRGFRRIGVGLVLLGLMAPAVQAAPRKVIDKPDWASKPTGDDLERFFPKRAQDESVSGKATIKCGVTAEGLLDRCKVLKEAPKGYGFGEAALAMASTFRMSPKRVDGQVVEGGQVTIPLVFNVPKVKDKPDFGDSAALLTRVGPAGPVGPDPIVMPCFDGQGDCQAHMLEWIARPDAKETARILDGVTPEMEPTYALCVVAANGQLEDCQLGGEVTPAAEAAAQAALKGLKASPKTMDDWPTASEAVMIELHWELLKLGSKEMAKRHPRAPEPAEDGKP